MERMVFYAPWRDKAGRFSWLKLLVFTAALAPAFWIGWQSATGGLNPRPLAAAIHQSGEWAIRLLLASLAVSPLCHLAHWPRLMTVRRMLGLAALAYVLLHFGLYTADQAFDIAKVAQEIALRFYLTIGFVAVIGLVVLGATSTDGMIRRLGGARWRRLHRIVYGLAVLGLVHYLLQTKLDISLPVITAGVFFWLMGYRGLKRLGRTGVSALLGLAAASAMATAVLEAAWYAGLTGVTASRVLEANLTWALAPRPAWWVLGGGLLMIAAKLALTVARQPPVTLIWRGTAAK